jgi:hypothetical protein
VNVVVPVPESHSRSYKVIVEYPAVDPESAPIVNVALLSLYVDNAGERVGADGSVSMLIPAELGVEYEPIPTELIAATLATINVLTDKLKGEALKVVIGMEQ